PAGSGEDVALVVLDHDRLTGAGLRRVPQYLGRGRLGVENHRLVATVELEDDGERLATLGAPTAFVAQDADLHAGVLGREAPFQHLILPAPAESPQIRSRPVVAHASSRPG